MRPDGGAAITQRPRLLAFFIVVTLAAFAAFAAAFIDPADWAE